MKWNTAVKTDTTFSACRLSHTSGFSWDGLSEKWTDATDPCVSKSNIRSGVLNYGLINHNAPSIVRHLMISQQMHTRTWQQIFLGWVVMFPASSWISILKLTGFPFSTMIGSSSGVTWRECGWPEKHITQLRNYWVLPQLSEVALG